MQVNVGLLETWFAEFNAKYFNGELPVPAFAVGNSRTRRGTMSWRIRKKWFSKTRGDYKIRISNYFNVEEYDFKNVLLHEMIHLHIVSKGIKDSSPHGVVFHEVMRRINADGWKINVSEKMSGKVEVARRMDVRWRVIMAVATTDGKYMLSVVNPRYVRLIDSVIKRSPNVQSCSWYISQDNYFSSFPVVRSPKGRIVSEDIFCRFTKEMQTFQ
ncbi:MAG: SprT-like domain-containing protein [Prevotella sp.]|nr:SprT-like domain-containing protein [Prevotella sp.]